MSYHAYATHVILKFSSKLIEETMHLRSALLFWNGGNERRVSSCSVLEKKWFEAVNVSTYSQNTSQIPAYEILDIEFIANGWILVVSKV